jgi:hypothetical protein
MRRRPLRGKNLAVTLGFFLQPLLQSPASPLAAFGFHFHLDLAQGARASGLGAHRFPWVVVAALATRATGFALHYGGSVKMRPIDGSMETPIFLLVSSNVVS